MEEREWISVEDRLPEIHTPVLCNFRHWNKKVDRQDVLIRVIESDCMWRVWDLGAYLSELSHDYNVTHWKPIYPPKDSK